MSLQEFYDLLPRPLPEPSLAKQNVSEVQAVGWLNQTIQSTRGSQLQAEYLPFTEIVVGLQFLVFSLYSFYC